VGVPLGCLTLRDISLIPNSRCDPVLPRFSPWLSNSRFTVVVCASAHPPNPPRAHIDTSQGHPERLPVSIMARRGTSTKQKVKRSKARRAGAASLGTCPPSLVFNLRQSPKSADDFFACIPEGFVRRLHRFLQIGRQTKTIGKRCLPLPPDPR
jgi:hypothetical protein